MFVDVYEHLKRMFYAYYKRIIVFDPYFYKKFPQKFDKKLLREFLLFQSLCLKCGMLKRPFQNFADVVGFSHRVIMNGGDVVGEQVFTLRCAPLDACLVYGFVVLAFD